jgi:cation diffusion facilitator family transporter
MDVAAAPPEPEVDDRTREVRRVVVLILWLNLAVAAAKAIYGWWSGSLSVASDAIHSTLDAGSNVIGMVALKLAASPPDSEHPYGHRKIEIMAATLIGVLIAGGSLRFAYSAIEALINGRTPPHVTIGGFLVMGGTLLTNIFVAKYEAGRGRALGSPFLVADAAHTSSDVLVTVAVLIALAGTRLGAPWADPVGALLVLVMVARVAWRILDANLGILLDRAVVNPAEVREIALAVPGVASVHRIRSRGVEGAVLLDLHLLVDGELTLRAAHEICHSVEEALRTKVAGIVDVTIHVEPHDEPEEGL